MNNVDPLVAFSGFTLIAGLTCYFSWRPRQFLIVFVPAEERRDAARWVLTKEFARSMRAMAALQFAAAILVALLCVLLQERSR
ncbi:MAG: hypothetical protein ACPGXX_04735 [Planctomycetaceae bacterium]